MKVHGCAETDLDSRAGGGPQGRVGLSGRLSTRGERWWLLPQAPSFRVAPRKKRPATSKKPRPLPSWALGWPGASGAPR